MKGADLILRPHQQKWLQEALETWTLKLNYLNVLKWFSRHVNKTFISVFGLLTLIIAFSFLHTILISSFQKTFQSEPLLFLGTAILSIFFAKRFKRTKLESFKYLDGNDFKEENKEYKLKIFFYRIVRVMFSFFLITALFFFLYSLIIYFLDKFLLKENLNEYLFGLWYISPLLIDLLGILILFLSMIILTLFIFLLHIIIKFIEQVCWRIVEYNKGAFSAINLIITVVLGIIELFLKR